MSAPMRPIWLVSVGLWLALSAGQEHGATFESIPPLSPRTDLRIERFVLETKSLDTQGRPRVELAGLAEWRRRDAAEGPQLECDVRFLRGLTGKESTREVQRVLQVECLTDRGPRCVWREVGPGSGRSVQAEWSADGRALDIAEWSTAGKRRGTLVASGGASMPLYLAELLRHGRLTSGAVTQFDPLARTLEPLTVRTVWLERGEPLASDAAGTGAAASRDQRTVELLRADGTLAARYRFAGLDLVAFQWQEGRLSARAVDDAEYERLLAENVGALVAKRSINRGE